jgi:hypothetical protein
MHKQMKIMCRQQKVSGRTTVAFYVMAALVAACASQSPAPAPASAPAPAKRVNLTGYSAAFRQGYADGCSSAESSRRRNEQRFRSETDYMMGWNDGFSICSKRK